jgi:cullin 3
MDRTYVQQQQKTQVFQLGLDLWRSHVIQDKAIKARLLNIMLDLVHKERCGEIIDRPLMRSITQVSGPAGAQ